jgi:hypothetical protein
MLDRKIAQLEHHIEVYAAALDRYSPTGIGIAHSVLTDARRTLAVLTGNTPATPASRFTSKTARGAMNEIRSEIAVLLINRDELPRLSSTAARREAKRMLESGAEK